MFEDFPWIKFTILVVPFWVMMWIFAPSLKWKLLFSLAGPIGIYLALVGKSINPHSRSKPPQSAYGGGY